MKALPVVLVFLLTACSFLGSQEVCTPELRSSSPYAFTVGTQTIQSMVNIGIAQRGDRTAILLRDASGYATDIRIEIVEPLAVGETNIPDPTATYPSDYVPPITVRGTEPNGDEGGVFFGGITINQLDAGAASGSFNFRVARANKEPVVIQGGFDSVEIQPCQ